MSKLFTRRKAKNEIVLEEQPKVLKRIIGNKLYDTSQAELVCTTWRDEDEILKYMPYKPIIRALNGYQVKLYKGVTEWFIVVCGSIYAVDEEFAKNCLMYYPEKYVEYFGEVELA